MLFEIDDESGTIARAGYWFDVGLQGALGDLQVLGDRLLITGESTAIDSIRGPCSFAIEPNGSFT